jgi:hypothetical protein
VYVSGVSAQATEDGFTVEAAVTNDGTVDTQDVVQIYCQNNGSANAPKNPRLCAFQRVTCPAGSTVKVALTVAKEALKVVNDNGELVEEGSPVLFAGVGQPDSRTAALTGHEALSIEL